MIDKSTATWIKASLSKPRYKKYLCLSVWFMFFQKVYPLTDIRLQSDLVYQHIYKFPLIILLNLCKSEFYHSESFHKAILAQDAFECIRSCNLFKSIGRLWITSCRLYLIIIKWSILTKLHFDSNKPIKHSENQISQLA